MLPKNLLKRNNESNSRLDVSLLIVFYVCITSFFTIKLMVIGRVLQAKIDCATPSKSLAPAPGLLRHFRFLMFCALEGSHIRSLGWFCSKAKGRGVHESWKAAG